MRSRLTLAATLAAALLSTRPAPAQISASGGYSPSPFSNPTWDMGPTQTLKIGSGSAGSLTISANGSVWNGIGVVGETASGLVNVSGGNWTNSGSLIVGLLSTGTLNLSAGSISSAGSVISRSSFVNVTGGNWTNSGTLTVGSQSYGRLEISGGAVTNTGVTIGSGGGVAGEVAVLGGNWSSSGVVVVGSNGTGTLVVAGGAAQAFEVAVGTQAGSQGSVSLAGGILSVTNIWKGSGSGNVTFTGGTVRLTSSQSRLFDNFSDGEIILGSAGGAVMDTNGFSVTLPVGLAGQGSLAKLGDGVLSLRGNNTYSGGTVVRRGTLEILSGGNLHHPSALLEIGSLSTENGTLLVSGGAVTVSGTNVGSNLNANGTLRITGGSLETSSLNVGVFGSGLLNISGGIITAQSVAMASEANSTGVLTLSGGMLSTGQISRGQGNGTVTLAGGTVRLTGDQGNLFSGFANGDVVITGGATIDTQEHTVATSQSLTGNGSLAKQGTGTLSLSGNTSLSGGIHVAGGTLHVSGSLSGGTSGITVATGALLTGTGRFTGAVNVGGLLTGTGTFDGLAGAGSIAPGNSPGILTAATADLSSGLSFHFEVTAAPGAMPAYGNATQSGNDVLRLTGADPFASSSATSSNTFNVYLGLTTLTYGDVFLSGIFTDRNSDFSTATAGATFSYFVYGDGNGTISYNGKNYYALAQFNGALGMAAGVLQIPVAAFADGSVSNGWQQTFTVIPEPSSFGLLVLGASGLWALGWRRSRRASRDA